MLVTYNRLTIDYDLLIEQLSFSMGKSAGESEVKFNGFIEFEVVELFNSNKDVSNFFHSSMDSPIASSSRKSRGRPVMCIKESNTFRHII
jgi:hypothetical protein